MAGRQQRVPHARRGRRVSQVQGDQLRCRRALERRPPAQHLVQDRPQRVHVGPGVDGRTGAPALFGCTDIIGVPSYAPPAGVPPPDLAAQPGNAEVQQLDPLAAVQFARARKMFSGFRCPWMMPRRCAAPSAAEVISRMASASSSARRPTRRSRAPRFSPSSQLHQQIGQAIRQSPHVHNTSTKLGCSSALAARASYMKRAISCLVLAELPLQDFQRCLATDDRVLGQVYPTCLPLTDQVANLEVVDVLSDQLGLSAPHPRPPVAHSRLPTWVHRCSPYSQSGIAVADCSELANWRDAGWSNAHRGPTLAA